MTNKSRTKTISTEAIHIGLLSLKLKINNIYISITTTTTRIWVQIMKTTRKLRASDCSAMHRHRISMDRSSRYVENSSKTTFFHSQSHTSTHAQHSESEWSNFEPLKTTNCYLSPSRDRRLCKEKKTMKILVQCLYVCAQFVDFLIRETPFPTKSTFVCTHRFFYSAVRNT